MQNKKLLIVYSQNSPAAEFVLQGIKMNDVSILKIQFNESLFCKVFYFLFYKLKLFKISSFFRFNSDFRKKISNFNGQILFWDCCDLFIYKLLNTECKPTSSKSVFFWNPLGFHKAERISVGIMLEWLKKHQFSLSTFDPEDSIKFSLPLFCNVNRKVKFDNIENDCDFYFVGLPKGREEELNRLKVILERNGYTTKFIIPKRKSEYISQMQNVVFSAKARCIVDFVSSKYGQSGLTLRPFDALFLKKKLISNCKSLVKYDFFNENNVFILSDQVTGDDIEKFMETPYKELDETIVNKYEVNNWIKKYFLL